MHISPTHSHEQVLETEKKLQSRRYDMSQNKYNYYY